MAAVFEFMGGPLDGEMRAFPNETWHEAPKIFEIDTFVQKAPLCTDMEHRTGTYERVGREYQWRGEEPT